MGSAILFLVYAIIQLAIVLVLVTAVLSWLVAFDVINVRNPNVFRLVRGLDQVTDPLLRPIRRVLPPLGGMDLSPIVLLLLLQALEILIRNTVDLPLRAALG